MELFVKIANGLEPLTIFAKSSILYVGLDFEYVWGVNNQFVGWELYQSALYQVCIISLYYFESTHNTT